MEANTKKSVLFLQGPLSPLYRHIGTKLLAKECEVHRINFSLGDWLHWHDENCTSYRGKRSDWPNFISEFLQCHNITDLILHSDSRWYHKKAITAAHRLNIQISVTELGAIRPGRLTLEKNGLGLNSHFPDDPELILRRVEQLPSIENMTAYRHPFWIMALYDAAYNLINSLLWFVYPNFKRHTPHPPFLEYPSWIPRLLSEKAREKEANLCISKLIDENQSFYIFPLQLSGDFQIRTHSPYPSMCEAINEVLDSFSKSAPKHTKLLVKQHPLDVGLDKLKSHTLSQSKKLGISNRVIYIDGGDLQKACQASKGMITVNSTAGIEALQLYKPVKTLVTTLYDMPYLTHQGTLASFWNASQRPDPLYVNAFIKLLLNTTQIEGAIYGQAGIEKASHNICQRILKNSVSQPGGYTDTPPRIKKAFWRKNSKD